ncbi:protein disulfide oxidoreductase [Microbulbifer hainanensis]|uniref:protein disulfide oxidoreductase n=1 Tax=Microbulbifer hainanensis TaxID=2735675 RepID=UPI0029BFFE29|nr:protein disulfide oxidoreductase [Microbulbifer hainanensis]
MKRLLRKLRSLAGFALAAVLMASGIAYYQQRDVPKDRAPALAARTLAGDVVDLQQKTVDGPVLLYFWATWCGYCRAVSPVIDDLAGDYQVISVALQSGDGAQVQQYLDDKELHFPTINDPNGAISSAWGVRVTPTIVIVGSDGKVSWVTSGTTTKWGLEARLAMTE